MRRTIPLIAAACAALLVCTAAPLAAQPERQQQPRGMQYVPLAPGVLTGLHFATDSIPGYRAEVRDLLLGPGQQAENVPLTGPTLMELRSGQVETTINGRTLRRREGDHWLVPGGARLAIRNLAEVSVIRAIQLASTRACTATGRGGAQ